MIGLSENSGPSLYLYNSTKGVITPRTDGFNIKNIKFYNFISYKNMASIGSCSHCEHPVSSDSGGRTVRF